MTASTPRSTRRTTRSAAAVAAAALALTVPGAATQSAHASADVTTDPADVRHGVDLRSVKVTHGENALTVRLDHKNLRPHWRTGSSGSVFVDVDPDDRGPELVFAGGFFRGTDYALVSADGFRPATWGEPVDCEHRMRVDYAADTVHMRIGADCLDGAEQVRVAVKVGGERRDGSTVTDWLSGRRHFTDWVARG